MKCINCNADPNGAFVKLEANDNVICLMCLERLYKASKLWITDMRHPWQKEFNPDLVKDERKSPAYKKWRSAVLFRDEIKCQHCGSLDDLVAHHIKGFADFTHLRYEVSNGITLCSICHKKQHKR